MATADVSPISRVRHACFDCFRLRGERSTNTLRSFQTAINRFLTMFRLPGGEVRKAAALRSPPPKYHAPDRDAASVTHGNESGNGRSENTADPSDRRRGD